MFLLFSIGLLYGGRETIIDMPLTILSPGYISYFIHRTLELSVFIQYSKLNTAQLKKYIMASKFSVLIFLIIQISYSYACWGVGISISGK